MTNIPFDPRTLKPIGYGDYGPDPFEIAKRIILDPVCRIKQAIDISFDDIKDYDIF